MEPKGCSEVGSTEPGFLPWKCFSNWESKYSASLIECIKGYEETNKQAKKYQKNKIHK